MESALRTMEVECKGRGAGIPIFDEETAHLLLAAADFVVVPSRFEPCGLVAQSGCRYGAVPIVTSVGGLKDLVTPEVSSSTIYLRCSKLGVQLPRLGVKRFYGPFCHPVPF